MSPQRRYRSARVVGIIVVGLAAIGFAGSAAALCAGPKEGGRWWNTNPAGDPVSLEVTLDSCGDQVLNGRQTETTYSLKVFTMQANGTLSQRQRAAARYVKPKGEQWLYAEVPTGGYVDKIWLRPVTVKGESQLEAIVQHASLDSKPSAASKLFFSRHKPVASKTSVHPQDKKALSAAPSAGASAIRGSATCKSGFVWREARPNDLVCVTPESRATVAMENRNAAQGVQPGAAPNCRSGLVWREAFSGDVVCVSPRRREEVRAENTLGPNLRAQR